MVIRVPEEFEWKVGIKDRSVLHSWSELERILKPLSHGPNNVGQIQVESGFQPDSTFVQVNPEYRSWSNPALYPRSNLAKR